jgi:hypothetical protein
LSSCTLINNEYLFCVQKFIMPTTSSGLPLDDKTAIRFLVKKTKRFNFPIQVDDTKQMEQNHLKCEELINMMDKEMDDTKDKKLYNAPSSLEALLYSELSQNKTPVKNPPEEESEPEFVFRKPKVYRCCYCHKVFFHSFTYRRHMLHHLKNRNWCRLCSRGFISRKCYQKHKLLLCNIK